MFFMKRLLLLLVAIVSVLHASAQGLDSKQQQSAAISADSLFVRLNKLQHDNDFMYCDYELHKMIMDLKDLSQSIEIASNRVVINYYNNNFNSALYSSYLRNYNSNSALFDSLKEKKEVIRFAVFAKISSSGFTDTEVDVLNNSFDLINKTVIAVENSLNYYDVAIKTYRSKR